jgi:hypothetical protein
MPTRSRKPTLVAASQPTSAATRRTDLLDFIHVQLDEHRALCEMMGAVAALCSQTVGQSDSYLTTEGLWEGLRCVAQRIAEESDELKKQVDALNELALTAGGAQ